MMAFFDTPGSTAGPYHTPAQQGIFSKIIQGVNVALKLGDFYQDWKTKSQAQKTGALKGLADQIGITQALNPEGAAAPPEIIAQAEKTGVPLPKMTDKMRTGMGESVMSGITPTVGEAVPGGGMATRLASPELAQKQAGYTQGMAAIPAIGTPMIPGKQSLEQEKLRVLRGMPEGKRAEALWPRSAPGWVYDEATDSYKQAPSGGMVRVVRAPRETSEEQTARQIAVKQATPGGKAGSGKSGSGKITDFETMYQQQLQVEPGLTRFELRKRLLAKPDPTKIKTIITEGDLPGGRGSQKTITKEKTDGSGTPAPAGKVDYGPPIGKTPDGRLIYKGADGKPITLN